MDTSINTPMDISMDTSMDTHKGSPKQPQWIPKRSKIIEKDHS